jgi:hypothetical protein
VTNEARRYWEAVAARDSETARAIAKEVMATLHAQADAADSRGDSLVSAGLRLGASAIEKDIDTRYARPADPHEIA